MQLAKDKLKPCGTEAAYKRHRRHGEKPCGQCLAAHVAYAGSGASQRKRRRERAAS